MDNIYLVILVILMALAVSDLVVGVSNDAANFLNSALGSKAAPRYVILIVASAGILLGSVFSSGMMEIARKGVFYPEAFFFRDVMMIFLAVMFTDVILLDMFNTFGLPTSTTVSLIFELLGAAVAVALVKIWTSNGLAADLGTYINAGKAMGIISGILLSVILAFVVGSIVMFVTRLIFSFRYKKSFGYFGSFWCGFALTAITYFAIFKGLQDTSLLSPEMTAYMDANIFQLVAISFIGWTVVMWLVQHLFKLNILKFTVLAGTFSLALAFAGNDLVNFIGVFMAGFESYNIAAAFTGDIATLKMSQLAEPVQAQPLMLFIAGGIMVLTLIFSKKAKTLSDTEINLARQDEGIERFGSTSLSRTLVRSALNFNKKYEKYIPARMQRYVSHRFTPTYVDKSEKAPFDLIRATVNLTTASILIAMATSMKLPLSTTYVTFMVAMGTSLADRAWGRESAVYRITGVLTVITGWFLTAFIAFSVAFLVGLALMYGGNWVIYALTIVCALILIQNKFLYARRQKKIQKEAAPVQDEQGDIMENAKDQVSEAMQKMTSIYSQTLTGLFSEDRKLLKKMVAESEEMYQAAHERKHKVLPVLHQLELNNIDTGHYYVQVADYLNEVAKALVHITRPSFEHINNNHEGLSREQVEDLRIINRNAMEIYTKINHMLQTDDFSELEDTMHKRDELFEILSQAIKHQVKRVMDNDSSAKGSLLYLEIINETKTMVLQSRNMLKSQRHFVSANRDKGLDMMDAN